jgi:hypothetical protein
VDFTPPTHRAAATPPSPSIHAEPKPSVTVRAPSWRWHLAKVLVEKVVALHEAVEVTVKPDRQGILQHVGRPPLVSWSGLRGLLVNCGHLNPGGVEFQRAMNGSAQTCWS